MILFFDHILVTLAEVFPTPQHSHVGLSWQLTRKASDPNQSSWHNWYVPHRTLWNVMAYSAIIFTWKIQSLVNTVKLSKLKAFALARQGKPFWAYIFTSVCFNHPFAAFVFPFFEYSCDWILCPLTFTESEPQSCTYICRSSSLHLHT